MAKKEETQKKTRVRRVIEKLTFEKGMSLFQTFIETVTGKKDIQSKLAVLSDPKNLKTMSILRKSEADFVIESYWASRVPEWGTMFAGLRALADEKLETCISIEGKGREQVIGLAGAMTESKLAKMLQLGVAGEKKE